MKPGLLVTTVLGAALTLLPQPVFGHIRLFDVSRIDHLFDRLHEVDFEGVDVSVRSGPGRIEFGPNIPNPLTLDGVTLSSPQRISGGYCSSPTCQPDPDNAHGANIVLSLSPKSVISFEQTPKLVVLDIQGMGNSLFVLTVTDGRGHKRRVRDRGTLYGTTLVGLSSDDGIRQVAVNRVGTRGGISLARVLFFPADMPTLPGGVVPFRGTNVLSVRAWAGPLDTTLNREMPHSP